MTKYEIRTLDKPLRVLTDDQNVFSSVLLSLKKLGRPYFARKGNRRWEVIGRKGGKK